jgi:hypothetical protein
MKTKNLLTTFITLIIAVNVFAQPTVRIQKVIGGDSTDRFTSMDLTSDGGMIVGGTSYSGISGEKTGAVKGGTSADYWVVKLDSKGKIEWDKTIGGDGLDQLRSVRQTKDGGYILGGLSASGISGDKTVTGSAWVVKLDYNGNIEWDKTYSGYREEDDFSTYGVEALEVTKDGGYIINILVFSSEPYYSPVWVVKTDRFGNVQWDDIAVGGETLSINLSNVIQTRDSGYLIGYTNYDHTGEVFYYGISRMDKAGNLKWSKSYYNREASSVMHALAETPRAILFLRAAHQAMQDLLNQKTGTGRVAQITGC